MDPEITTTVVIPSHRRPLRLRWLLNALEDQTSERAWEAIVVHDLDAATAERVIDRHPLAAAGRVRHIAIEPGAGSPARQRNIGWRAARGRFVAFTDDDCRPDPRWLDRLLASVRDPETDVVQGATHPDPLERDVLAAPHVRTLHVDPPGPFAQTSNILYPRALLERLGGFDERAVSGEDVELARRAVRAGSRIVGARRAVVFHAVESHSLPGMLGQNLKWRHLAYLVKRRPEVRRDLTLRIFWDDDHLAMTVALAGLALARRHRSGLLLSLPYALRAARRRGPGLRAHVTATVELPGQAVRQVGEILGMAAGSIRYRTILL